MSRDKDDQDDLHESEEKQRQIDVGPFEEKFGRRRAVNDYGQGGSDDKKQDHSDAGAGQNPEAGRAVQHHAFVLRDGQNVFEKFQHRLILTRFVHFGAGACVLP